jgi:GTP-binding protein
MIVGMHPREEQIPINVCREKKLTNMRSSTSDVAKRLSPSVKMSLEESLDFISTDELVEVTPQNYRLRKRELSATTRHKHRKNVATQQA